MRLDVLKSLNAERAARRAAIVITDVASGNQRFVAGADVTADPLREILATVNDALHFRLAHDDLTHYNAVQKILYLGVMAVGVLIVVSGLALWKPVQFSELAMLFYDFQTARLVHFLCMTAIVLFLIVHVALALIVPRSLVAMVTGGPVVKEESA